MGISITESAVSNRDWKAHVECTDEDTGDLIDFTGAFIAMAVEDSNQCQKILATTDNGKISIISLGIFELSIPYSEMTMPPGSYDIGGYYQVNGEVVDILEGTMSVRRGIPKP